MVGPDSRGHFPTLHVLGTLEEGFLRHLLTSPGLGGLRPDLNQQRALFVEVQITLADAFTAYSQMDRWAACNALFTDHAKFHPFVHQWSQVVVPAEHMPVGLLR